MKWLFRVVSKSWHNFWWHDDFHMGDDSSHWLASIDEGNIQEQHNHYDGCRLFFRVPSLRIWFLLTILLNWWIVCYSFAREQRLLEYQLSFPLRFIAFGFLGSSFYKILVLNSNNRQMECSSLVWKYLSNKIYYISSLLKHIYISKLLFQCWTFKNCIFLNYFTFKIFYFFLFLTFLLLINKQHEEALIKFIIFV